MKVVRGIFFVRAFSRFGGRLLERQVIYDTGLNYYLTNQVKIMGEARMQFSTEKNNYEGRIQFQIFFNK